MKCYDMSKVHCLMLSRLPARAKRKCIIFVNFQWRREAKMAIFKLSLYKSLYSCPTQLLKYSREVTSPVLSDILNTSVSLGAYPQNLKYQKLYLSSKLTTRPTLLIIGQFHYYQISIESSRKFCTTE